MNEKDEKHPDITDKPSAVIIPNAFPLFNKKTETCLKHFCQLREAAGRDFIRLLKTHIDPEGCFEYNTGCIMICTELRGNHFADADRRTAAGFVCVLSCGGSYGR